jgi:putative CRISPR-associated protein (TIGR02619 family)
VAQPQILLCTVGTSLFRPNLEGLKKQLADGTLDAGRRALAEAYQEKDWPRVARELGRLPGSERLCGAEINSVASMIDKGHVPAGCGLFFLHSDTDDGRNIGAILKAYALDKGHAPVEASEIADMQDQDPKRFRTRGLRNLARDICRIIRQFSAPACAINATGGYKAQIAVAVLLGQALGVPVYYKHEMFSEIIAFPPMPIALDFEVWMRAGGMLRDLERSSEPVPAGYYAEDWDEKFESLVERVSINGQDYLELSPTGQIFHETFRERFRSSRDQVLPPAVPAGQKKKPILKSDEGHMLAHRDEIERFLVQMTGDVAPVALCVTKYFNPDLPERTRFRLGGDGIEGILSSGGWTVKFRVETSAQTAGQQAAVVAALNEWLDGYLGR